MTEGRKPPLGATPASYFDEGTNQRLKGRARELVMALSDHVEEDYITPSNRAKVASWAKELATLIEFQYPIPPCHERPANEWCDYKGLGDFMGHTCKPKTS